MDLVRIYFRCCTATVNDQLSGRRPCLSVTNAELDRMFPSTICCAASRGLHEIVGCATCRGEVAGRNGFIFAPSAESHAAKFSANAWTSQSAVHPASTSWT
jgi:hypothetical protein